MATAKEKMSNGKNEAVISDELNTTFISSVEEDKHKYRNRYILTIMSTISALVVISAIAILLATLVLPVLQVSGSQMEPTLYDGDIIVLTSQGDIETGDLIGFYYQNKLLIKRVIGGPGDIIDIDIDGNVTVNGELLDENYISEKAVGDTDLVYPYQVSVNSYFIMGDNRETSIDSRKSIIGCIEKEQIVGKVFIRVWPLKSFGSL